MQRRKTPCRSATSAAPCSIACPVAPLPLPAPCHYPTQVVTYNTLIDVYGKTGQWAEALKVLARMKEEVRRGGGPAGGEGLLTTLCRFR